MDDSGQRVQLDRAAQRIVSLAPHVTEMVFAAGAGRNLVGVSEYSDYPEAARSIARIGDAQSFDFETIVKLKPDLIIGWMSGNPSRLIDKLRSLSLAVYLTEPEDLEDIAVTIETIGALTDHESEARLTAEKFRAALATLRDTHRDKRSVSVFHPIWSEPMMTLTGNHIFSRLLELCGGTNIFADIGQKAAEVSVEAILAANPDVIIGAADAGDESAARGFRATFRAWPSLSAVSNDRLYTISSDIIHRPTPRLLDGARAVCERLDRARASL